MYIVYWLCRLYRSMCTRLYLVAPFYNWFGFGRLKILRIRVMRELYQRKIRQKFKLLSMSNRGISSSTCSQSNVFFLLLIFKHNYAKKGEMQTELSHGWAHKKMKCHIFGTKFAMWRNLCCEKSFDLNLFFLCAKQKSFPSSEINQPDSVGNLLEVRVSLTFYEWVNESCVLFQRKLFFLSVSQICFCFLSKQTAFDTCRLWYYPWKNLSRQPKKN